MSLIIGIAAAESNDVLLDKPYIELEDDGYYWFMHDAFLKLLDETDQYIDLYGHAKFEGDKINALAACLANIQQNLSQQPAQFESCIGSRGDEKVIETISRDYLQGILNKWQIILQQAKSLGYTINCFGD
jgi:hypothetical protein